MWKELWQAARKFSELNVYKGIAYPNVSSGSRCVLCHQLLADEAKERFVSFDEFVKDDLQRAAIKATNELDSAMKVLEELPSADSIKTRFDASGVQDEGLVSDLLGLFTRMQVRRKQIFGPDLALPKTSFVDTEDWIKLATNHLDRISGLADKYENDALNDSRDAIKQKLNILETREWLLEHKDDVQAEVERLKSIKKLREAKKLTSTRRLSIKKGELAEVLLTKAFADRFNSELKSQVHPA